jgi:hypothetical protein
MRHAKIPIMADIEAMAKLDREAMRVTAKYAAHIELIDAQKSAILKPWTLSGNEKMFVDQYEKYREQQSRKESEPS